MAETESALTRLDRITSVPCTLVEESPAGLLYLCRQSWKDRHGTVRSGKRYLTG